MADVVSFDFGENFEKKFLKDNINNPEIAVIELVANSWDAKATEVHIEWPIIDGLVNGEKFSIIDNGEGMTRQEFEERWSSLGVDKRKYSSSTLNLEHNIQRKLLGRNGKGRLGLFGFSNSYTVVTAKNNLENEFIVKKSNKSGEYANIIFNKSSPTEKRGTKISCPLFDHYVDVETLKEELSIRFGADTHFKVFLNEEELKLIDFKEFDTEIFDFNGNSIKIISIPRKQYNKKLSQYQLVWWVNQRAVQTNTWKELDIPLDIKNKFENKYIYCVVVDFLEEYVKPDWNGFEDNDLVKNVFGFVKDKLIDLTKSIRSQSVKNRKISALNNSKSEINKINKIGQRDLGILVEEIIKNCKNLDENDLNNIVNTLVKMESSHSKYNLFEKIAAVSSAEIDTLNDILEKWSINDAYLVLDELYNRLRLTEKLDVLVNDSRANELKQIHPLIQEGLWIFGPEYEGTTNFTSNKGLNKVMVDLLGVKDYSSENSKRRPDLVVLEDGSVLSLFSSNEYEETSGVVKGYRKILIIELKKGNSVISFDEKIQAKRYAKEIEKHGKLSPNTEIVCYVLGSKLDPFDDDIDTSGKRIKIIPKTYDILLETAKNRTFNLINEIRDVKGITDIGDPEINEILKRESEDLLNY